MKTLKLLLFTISLTSLFSCNQEEIEINQDLITGQWNLEQVTLNNINGTEINDWISNSTILNIDDNKSYYRNYVSGEWSLIDDKLNLIPIQELQIDSWNYQILELTKKTLKIKVYLTESEYCCDFEQFVDDEILTIVETYIKSE